MVEAVYGDGVGPLLASVLSRLTGLVPLALAEILMVGFVAWYLVQLGRGIADVWNGSRAAGNAAAAGALDLGAGLGVVVALFYLLWGFHYARPPLEERLGWDGSRAEIEEVARLAREMVEATNFEYASIHSTDDAGEPTGAVIERDELFEDLEEGWQAGRRIVGRAGWIDLGFGRPKPVTVPWLLDRLQISGFYFPWTGEANYNPHTPAPSLPHAIAHEMAHQRGHAPENEANFVGFLVAAESPHAWQRYSAYLFAQRQLLGVVARRDAETAEVLLELRLPGVQRDVDAVRAHWARFEGPASRASRRVNDRYLRTQGVPGGILSYGRSVELLVAYARSRGGWLLREPRPSGGGTP